MIIINLIGLALIALIIWWFWLYKTKATAVAGRTASATESINITVENGIYQPARVAVNEDSPITLNFIRKDASPCAATVIFPDLELNAELPLNKNFTVKIPALKKGRYDFHCPMKMYVGSVIVGGMNDDN
jgi:plastocyanin domain-containing protein